MSPAFAAGAAITAPMKAAKAVAKMLRLERLVILLPPVFIVTNILIG
jgi:hypothetical protein